MKGTVAKSSVESPVAPHSSTPPATPIAAHVSRYTVVTRLMRAPPLRRACALGVGEAAPTRQ